MKTLESFFAPDDNSKRPDSETKKRAERAASQARRAALRTALSERPSARLSLSIASTAKRGRAR